MSLQIKKLKLNNATNDAIKNCNDTGIAPCESILMVRLKDLIHRVKGLELHPKPTTRTVASYTCKRR